jgi:hypothetical protein
MAGNSRTFIERDDDLVDLIERGKFVSQKKKISVPVSPVIHAALRAIYSGGQKSK